ncbi:hypothetical protein FGB62_5g326 [Gracilaria domingensis]|nr:hypothetical protein FGB62_5g326 [Gracilaria domingensis]
MCPTPERQASKRIWMECGKMWHRDARAARTGDDQGWRKAGTAACVARRHTLQAMKRKARRQRETGRKTEERDLEPMAEIMCALERLTGAVRVVQDGTAAVHHGGESSSGNANEPDPCACSPRRTDLGRAHWIGFARGSPAANPNL